MLPFEGELATDLRADGVEVIVRRIAVLRREVLSAVGLSGLVAAAWRDAVGLSTMIRRRRIALVHSNTSVVLSGAAAAAAARVPHVWHVREIYSGTGFDRAWPRYRRALARAAAVPCVSRATAAQFDGLPGDREHVRVIHDGLAVDAVRAPRADARAALGLPSETPVVAMLGRISAWKGQDLLVRALAAPQLASIGAIGVIAGDAWPSAPERLQDVVQLAARLHVADRVHFIGFRDDVENIYGAADIIAVPSTAPDPLPGAAVEAAAAGCAVLAADHGGLPEIIRDGETGRLFAAGDPVALASAARALLDDGEQRDRFGAAAAVDARARFAPARLLDAVQALYDELLSS